MRSARVRKPAIGVSLFPFLAVLICTMGALIVLLIMVVQQARVQAQGITRDDLPAASGDQPSPEELKVQQEDNEWRREILEKQRAELTQKLADERSDVGYLEEHIRRLQDDWKKLVAQAEELNRTGKVKPEEQATLAAEQARLKQALETAKRDLEEAQKQLSKKPRSFAIIPYKGPNGTHRRPIYIECRGDAIIFQPEGIMLGPADFDGPLGPGNPFDAALRATREYLDGVGGNQGGEPYPLLVVRPDGAVAYALARSAMKSWDEEFGYELIDQDMNLAFPPADPQLGAIMQRALADARRRQEMLARVAPSRFKGVGSSRGRGGSGSGSDGRGGGDGEGFDEHYGVGAGRGDSSGGSGSGSGGAGRTPGSGGLASGGSRGGSFGAGSALGAGPGKGGGVGNGVGTGTGAGGENVAGGGSGTGGTGTGAGGFYSDKPAFGQPGPLAQAGQPGGSAYGRPGQIGTGAGGKFGSGSGLGGSGGTESTGAGNADLAGNAGAAAGPQFGGSPGSGGQYGGNTGAKPGTADASGGSKGTAGGSATGSPSGSSAGGSPGNSASGSSAGSPGGASGGSQFGSSGGMPAITFNQDENQGQRSESSSDKSRDRKPPKRRRSTNWGLPNSANEAVGYTRPIRIACAADKLVVLPERGDGNTPQVVPLDADAPAPIDDFVGAVWKHMDRWGSAGQRAYWKPVLNVQVAPGGEQRFAELQTQLQGSGLEVKRK